MFEPFTLIALALDALLGWPSKLYRIIGHPVGFFAFLIQKAEGHWNTPNLRDSTRRALGVLLVASLLLLIGSIAWLLQTIAIHYAGIWGWVIVGILAWPALAQRSLYEHVEAVRLPLETGNLDQARLAVSMIVGRDTANLDAPATARAAIESLAESFCDGVAAPCFWLALGGLPGVWVYKAINTADSLIGHKEPRWRAFGWASARLDDVMNWVPARLGGAIICIAGNLSRRSKGWRVMWRDSRRHASPNAGWTEAAMAGVLGLKLAGPISYDDIVHDKEWIGDGRENATANDIHKALKLYKTACFLLWLLAGGVILWAH